MKPTKLLESAAIIGVLSFTPTLAFAAPVKAAPAAQAAKAKQRVSWQTWPHDHVAVKDLAKDTIFVFQKAAGETAKLTLPSGNKVTFPNSRLVHQQKATAGWDTVSFDVEGDKGQTVGVFYFRAGPSGEGLPGGYPRGRTAEVRVGSASQIQLHVPAPAMRNGYEDLGTLPQWFEQTW